MFTKACNSFGVRLAIILILIIGMSGGRSVKPVLAATLTVTNTNDSGPGSLRQTIADSVSGSTITFDPSLAGQTIILASDLIINKDLTIDGSGLSSQLTISGANVAHLITQNSPRVTISDLTIADGYTSGNGGAIISSGILTLINTTLRNNFAAGSGGAIYAPYFTIKNTAIYLNQASGGGAISMPGNGMSTIVNSTITQNQASSSGGAMFLQGSAQAQVFNSTFAHNTASTASELFLINNTDLLLSNTVLACAPGNSGCIVQTGNSFISSPNSVIDTGTLASFGLGELADNGGPTKTMTLLPGSPLIDAGDDTICANDPVNGLDQRGVTRPQGAHCDIGAFETEDAIRPTVISFDPENETLNVPVDSMITITFSEEINPATMDESSIFLTSFHSNTHIPVTVSSAGNVVTLTPNDPLEVGTTFLLQVTGAVEDLHGNSLNQVWLSSFTTGPNGVRDTTASDFSAGTLGACYLSNIENGEVTLPPLIGEEFSGTGLPANWAQLPLSNGKITVGNNAISADGAMAYYSNTTFIADHRLKFVGTFSAGQFQQVGLIGNPDFSGQWAVFSTKNTTDQLYAVTSDGQTNLIPGDFIGTKHTYEIIWIANAVYFYVDNWPTAFAAHTVTLTNLRPMLSDSSLDGQALSVEWMHFTPYSSPCTFTSRVFDAGQVVDWLNLASWTAGSQGTACIAALPPGPPLCTPNYGFTIETRTGNTAAPNGTWSGWQPAGSSIASPNGRYMQYRATLSSDTPGATQQLFSVVATYLKPPPTIYRVATNGASDPSCGASWSNPCDLQYALTTLIGSGDEVWVRAGTYKPGNDRTASFVMRDGVAIYGGFAGAETLRTQRDPATNLSILSGDVGVAGDRDDNSYHVVLGGGTNNTAILDGFMITAGNAFAGSSYGPEACGGGMENNASSPTLTNLNFSGNAGFYGGGMCIASSSPILTNVTFSNNEAIFAGGGIFNSSSNPMLTNITFSGNSANFGSGMANFFSSRPILTNVTFSDNLGLNGGGGMYNSSSNPILKNVTFSSNTAPYYGGGMYNDNSAPDLTNVTFVGNSGSHGGGMYNRNMSNPVIRNTIFWNNTAPNGAQIYNDTSSPVVSHSVIEGDYAGGTNIITTNPKLGTLSNNGGFTQTIPLLPGSSAINAGDDGNCPTTDQRGVSRPQGRHCDIGAFEYQKKSGNDTTGVFRPSNGLLYLKNSNTTGFADVAINYGLGGDYPVVGDWDGNGTVTIGIYRNGSFYLRNSNTIGFADIVFAFGTPGDQPIAGDWNGDGIDTIGVYRPSTGAFYLRNSNSTGAPDITFFLGNVGDVGIAGDWDGDGLDTTGVFRPVNGIIFLKNTNETGFADVALNYGIPGDKPVTGDWNNDGIDTIGVYRNGQFMLRNSNTIGFAEIVFGLGNPGDMPIAGNWDGQP